MICKYKGDVSHENVQETVRRFLVVFILTRIYEIVNTNIRIYEFSLILTKLRCSSWLI